MGPSAPPRYPFVQQKACRRTLHGLQLVFLCSISCLMENTFQETATLLKYFRQFADVIIFQECGTSSYLELNIEYIYVLLTEYIYIYIYIQCLSFLSVVVDNIFFNCFFLILGPLLQNFIVAIKFFLLK